MKLNTAYFYKKYIEQGGVLSYSVYKEIIDRYNKKVTDIAVTEGLGLKFRSNLGFLYVHQFERKPKIKENGNLSAFVDWKASNTLKAQLIEQGKKPLEVYKDAKGNIVGDNGGIPWLCYHTNTIFYKWLYEPNLYLLGHNNVVFKISWGNTKKIPKAVKENSDLLDL